MYVGEGGLLLPSKTGRLQKKLTAVVLQKEAIAADTICVSGTDKTGRHIEMRTGVNAIVKNGDMISHTTHRHEPPVTARPVGIAYEDDGLIAIDKPAGVPVHPAGRYNYNSVVEIMRSERPGLNPLRMRSPLSLTPSTIVVEEDGVLTRGGKHSLQSARPSDERAHVHWENTGGSGRHDEAAADPHHPEAVRGSGEGAIP